MTDLPATLLARMQSEANPRRSWAVVDFMLGTTLSAGEVERGLGELYVAGLVDQPSAERYRLVPAALAGELQMTIGEGA